MNKTAILLILTLSVVAAEGCRLSASRREAATVTRIRVTEEKYINDKLDISRAEVFVPTTNLAGSAEIRLASNDGDAFLTLTDVRIDGTNMWFRKWEFGRHPPPEGERSPFYMISSGSVGFETTPEHHLVIGDKAGIRESNKWFGKKDGTNIRTYLVITAEND